jgi:hypothetical protein
MLIRFRFVDAFTKAVDLTIQFMYNELAPHKD